MAKKSTANKTFVEVTKHKDKRKNIPTAELQDFVKEDEVKPKKILYPRDSSLDPQLVWKGKDEQDQKSLEVPAVPVYIQEKIRVYPTFPKGKWLIFKGLLTSIYQRISRGC